MAELRKVVVLGATGPTGRHLVPLLRDRNLNVRVVSRSEASLSQHFPEDDVEKIAADATREDEAIRAIDGCELAYDCIGLPPEHMAQHPVTARSIATGMKKTGARCIQVSSYWAYLPIVRVPLTEDHPRTDGPEWAQIRRETEDILLDAGGCVLHLPDFYGPYVHTSTVQNALVDAVNGRPMNWIGAADTPHELIYVPDAMKIAAEIASHDEADGERYVLPGSGPITGAEIAEIAGGKLRAAGPWLLKIVSLFNEDLRKFMPMVPHYAKTITYDASKLRGVIGDVEMTPYREGIRKTLEWLRR